MGNPNGKKNLMLTARILFTMQPSHTPRFDKVAQLLTEVGKMLRQVRDEVRGMQRRSMPQVPREAEKPKRLEEPERRRDQRGPPEEKRSR